MKIKSLRLENFRGIRHMELDLSSPLTLFVGANGAGKSTLLDAIAILLSWATARIRRSHGSGRELDHLLDIHNEASHASLSLTLEASQQCEYSWTMVRVRPGRKEPQVKSDYQHLNRYTSALREQIEATQERTNLPLFVYYPINRAVLDIPLRIRTEHKFGLLEAYDGALTSGADFRAFFEWFRNREDLENENRKYLDQMPALRPASFDFPDPQLETVRRALTRLLPGYRDFSVRRNPLRMVVLKQETELRIDQLSDGEKSLIATIGDLARRLAIANPTAEDPLCGEGIVLIDEIDLHLHPAWQRQVVKSFPEVFPNCQFLFSTHSPQALGEVEAGAIRILDADAEQGIAASTPEQSLGLTSDGILDEIMRSEDMPPTLARNADIESELHRLFQTIDNEDFAQARRQLAQLRSRLRGDTPDLVRAAGLIHVLDGDR